MHGQLPCLLSSVVAAVRDAAQFEDMYEQKRREVNKAFEKYEKQIKAAKQSGANSKAKQEKVLRCGCGCGCACLGGARLAGAVQRSAAGVCMHACMRV